METSVITNIPPFLGDSLSSSPLYDLGDRSSMMTFEDSGHFFTLLESGCSLGNFQPPGTDGYQEKSFGPKNQRNSTFNEGGDYRAMYLDPFLQGGIQRIGLWVTTLKGNLGSQ